MLSLWKASRMFNVPLYDDKIKDLNVFDLKIMDYLTVFENPKALEDYKKRFIDTEFEDYVKETEESDEWEEVDLDE